jgi:large subunit ribosomal protein L3
MVDKKKSERLTLTGKKLGMTKRFDETGKMVACTVVHMEPNHIVQVKTKENDGYQAIQLGAAPIRVKKEETLANRVTKPLLGHFKKAGLPPVRRLRESRIEDVASYAVGQAIGVEYFEAISFVDAVGISKGKGFQGVIKRHNFSGGPASHGSGFHRHGGSTGMRTTPGRCLPGQKKAGHMGAEQVSVQNLKVVEVDKENNVLIIKGAVPGPVGSFIEISPAIKL